MKYEERLVLWASQINQFYNLKEFEILLSINLQNQKCYIFTEIYILPKTIF